MLNKNNVVSGSYMQLAKQYWQLSNIWNNSPHIKSNMTSGAMIDQLNELVSKGIQIPDISDRKLLGKLAFNLLDEVIMGEGKEHPFESKVYELIIMDDVGI